MAVSVGGNAPTPDFQTGFLSARENASRTNIISKPDIKLNLLARGYIWIIKFLSNLAKFKK
ncbi:MAG: hypothetical protein NUV87_04580 [Candidatus Roizmanbacteria bacterium]|nr:hypothetical protein [Candidatus Roizmanbacteria bacterium]